MNFGYEFFFVISILEACSAYAPAASPPMLTHASMDVGNIISIVIPESPDENINVDQLTGEFRQQLERIKKQSRASKVEHGLVTLKRVLPEMSREEKRKTLPLIRRVLHGRRVSGPGIGRNWTREARMEGPRDGGQSMRGRSTLNFEDRRMHRDWDDIGNRDAVVRHGDPLPPSREDYRRIRERGFTIRRDEPSRLEDQVRREDQSAHENLIRRSDTVRPEESIRREKTERRDDQVVFPDDRPLRDWKNPLWDDQTPGDTRVYPEAPVDCDYKLERTTRQKDVNEIMQSEKFDKSAKFTELAVANGREDINAESAKLYSQRSPLYPPTRQDAIDNGKRNVKDFRNFESADAPMYVDYRRDFDVNAAIDPNCDDVKRNYSGHVIKDDPLIRKLQPQGSARFELENGRGSPQIVQDFREQSERFNASGLENAGSDGVYNYSGKKKRGYHYDPRGVASIKSDERWNIAGYADQQQPVNSSDEIREPINVYEMFGEKAIVPRVSYIQSEQGAYRPNVNNERKTQGPRSIITHGNDGLSPRIQRAANVTSRNTEIPRVNRVKNIFEELKRIFHVPELPVLSYNRVILLYGDGGEKIDQKNHETFTEAQKLQTVSSPSIEEPSSSTSRVISRLDQLIKDLSDLPT